MNWTNVNDGMPPEKDSIFAKCYGTRKTMEAHTTDGVWSLGFNLLKAKVLYWAPMPEPCKDDIKNIMGNLYIKDTSECPINTYIRNRENCKDCGFCERWE